MKIQIDIDLSPKEAREMLGLPDVEPMQQATLHKIQEKLEQGIAEMSDPELLMKRYLPLGIQGMEQFQQFMSTAAQAAKNTQTKAGKDD